MYVAPLFRQRVDGSQRGLLRWHRRRKKYYGWEFAERRSRDVAMATNFVARDGDKLEYSAFIVCAGILQGMEISQRWLLQ